MNIYDTVKLTIMMDLSAIESAASFDFEILPGEKFDKIVYRFSDEHLSKNVKARILETFRNTTKINGYTILKEIKLPTSF